MVALGAPGEELGLHLGNEIRLLLAHRLPQRVGLTLGKASELLAEQHHLLLIYGDAVGLGQVFLTCCEVVSDWLLPMFTAHESRDVLQRAGPVERVHGDQVGELRGLELLEVALHAYRLILEDAHRLPALEQRICGLVIEREGLGIELHPAPLADVLHRILDDGQGAQPEEVHLEQARILGHGVVELRADHVAVLGGGDGHEVGDVVRRDDDPAGVDAGVADRPLDDARLADDLALEVIPVVDGLHGVGHVEPLLAPQFFLELLVAQLEQLGERDVGHLLGQLVRLVVRELHHAGGVLERTLGGERAVGDDLRDLVGPVFVDHVFDDLAPPLVVEVDVDIGERYAVGVEEALEQQVVFDGVHVGDARAIGNGASRRRSAARPHAHSHLAGSRGEILHDEEVARVARALDGLELEVEALPDLVRDLGVPLLGPLVGQVAQVGVLPALPLVLRIARVNELLRDIEGGQQHIALQRIPLAPRHDVLHRLEGFRNIGEQRLHLLRRLHVELVVGQAEAEFAAALAHVALGLAHVGGVLHAQQDVVRIGFLAGRVVAVVGGDVAHAVLAAHGQQEVIDHLLLLEAVAVELGIEVFSEVLLPPEEGLFRLAVAHIEQETRHLAEQTAGEDDEVLLVLEQLIAVDARHVIEAVGVGQRAQLGQAVITRAVAGQQDNGVAVVLLRAVGVVAADVELRPYDGLDAGLVGGAHELEGAHHVAGVGQSDGGHSGIRGLVDERLHTGGRLEHAELTVDV